MVDLENQSLLKMKRRNFSKTEVMVALSAITIALLLTFIAVTVKKSLTILVDGKVKRISTYKSTIGGALSSSGIKLDEKDKISHSLDSKVNNNMIVSIKKAIPIEVEDGEKRLTIYTSEETVGKVLDREGIKLNENDKVIPTISDPINKDTKIKVVRVFERTIKVSERLPYKTLKKSDGNLEQGASKLVCDGVYGQKEVAYKVVYENGREISRSKVSETVKKAPIDKVVAVGSLSWFTPSRGGERVYYVKKLKMKATSYTADYASTGKRPGDKGHGVTATGTKVRRVPHGYSTVAVDPKVIPLGTRLYVDGYGFAIAEDVGGAVKGNIIDLYFNPGTNEYRSWSTRKVHVYIVK